VLQAASGLTRDAAGTHRGWMAMPHRPATALRGLLMLVLLWVAASAGTVSADTATEQLQHLQEGLRKARAAGDGALGVQLAGEQQRLLNGSPLSVLELARAEVRAGDLGSATAHVTELVRMGQTSALLESSAEFELLRGLPDFALARAGLQRNATPISLATVAFRLSDTALLAEDLDYSVQTRRFYVTSVREKKIVSLDAHGALSTFASAPDGWPMMAIRIDPRRHVVWATEVAIQDFVFSPQEQWGRSAVLAYDLVTGKLLQRIEGPQGSALGDMAITDSGDLLISDGDKGGFYRVSAHADQMERLDRGEFISPQTPAILADGRHVLVPDYVRGLAVLDLTTRQVRWLATRGRFALAGIDGLNLNHGLLLAVQNGASPERVVAFSVDASATEIGSAIIIERATETLGDPTHGVVVDGSYYYIANSGWDSVNDHGALKPGAKPTSALLMRVPITRIEKRLVQGLSASD
jgi:sugar lactone lactonase YvrE